MASFTRHGSGWRAHVFVDGRRKSRVFDKLDAAKKWARDTERTLEKVKRVGLTLAQAVERFERVESAARGSQKWDGNTFARIMAHFGANTPLTAIGKPEIARWRDKRLMTVSGSTVQREANLLRRLFTLARTEWEVTTHNPFEGVRLPDQNSPRRAVWTWPLIRRILRADRSGKTAEVIAAFRIALHTGMRLSEVLSAKVRGKVAVLPKDKTSKGEPVEVPLARKGAKLLASTPFTVGPNEASTLFSKLCAELLIEGLTFHDSRASALTWLSRRVDVMTLARISRHRDLKILLHTYYRESAAQIAERL